MNTPHAPPSPADAAPARADRPAPADFYRAESYVADESCGYLMRRVMNSLTQDIDRRLNEHDLTNAQWVPLFKIWRGEARTVAELARVCQADAGAMTRMLDRLEAKGFLRRVRSTTDRRVVNAELTPAGERAASRVPGALSASLNAHLAGFSREEWETMKALLGRMLVNGEVLKDAAGEAAP